MKTVKIELPDEDADALERAAMEGGFASSSELSGRRSQISSLLRLDTIPMPWPEMSPSTRRRRSGGMSASRPKTFGPGSGPTNPLKPDVGDRFQETDPA